ncbi:alpha-L-fucosidase [Aureibaculum sp. 2210JD6-5]|uniref:alpha-L-fucosidase n=1 Tax=Aureibaculum sp. 2210JD6-5 TaxID=3103957 RepID=UPI002AACE045|nr:alpha-L-fucosidase [Aureibaculum sp. 2210JD6-5]MDY7393990.1 alpha-L-fucosidase [Aureibaculum sp. 2210JD6-5]
MKIINFSCVKSLFLRKVLEIVFLILLISCAQEKTNKTEINSLVMPVSSTIEIEDDDNNDSIILKAAHIVPTENQYEALKDEFIAFIHFGPNTFTRMEWGNGMEDPKIFNLQNLDTDQWCKAMAAAQMKKVIITVKHHDGFVLWQSRYTKHGIMSTPFKDGKGDILRELSESCKKYDLKLGVYLSPADLYQIENKEGLYGNLSKYSERTIPRPVEGRPFKDKTTFTFNVDDYNEYFLNQLFELLTEYGPIHEVWFDGAHPKRKGGQTYNYLAWKELINTLAPEAVIFGKQDIRWCGNEAGGTRDTEFNVIPYKENPNQMNSFADITGEDIASRKKLYEANYLHYQPAETNTSIREGWFYRDDDKQKVRSADDVFDIYERSVGGNSTFLLNIPPNRDGKFSPEDVNVLEEVGKRINETYGKNLFEGAEGSTNVLDGDLASFEVLDSVNNEIVITSKEPVTINRIVLQEAIATHGERVEKHALDVWINNDWKEIAKATNIGYKRILRFPEVSSNKFRIRVLESRFNPTISNITAHYYKPKPPQLVINRDLNGLVNIHPKQHDFGWKPHGENASENINSGVQIRYTIDGTEPTSDSDIYKEPFLLASGEVRAKAEANDEKGSLASQLFGIVKKDWKIVAEDSFSGKQKSEYAIDENPNTFWQSGIKGNPHYIEIDLSKEYGIKGFIYTPQKEHNDGMIEKGVIKSSRDGKSWQLIDEFEFGNLINDPTARTHYFKQPINAQFIRIESKVIAGGNKTAAIAEIDFLVE